MESVALAPWDKADTGDPPVSGLVRDVADELFARIAKGHHRFGTRLPSERLLAEGFSVSRVTVRQALSLLERHGVIERRAGSGSVVRYRPAPADEGTTAHSGPLDGLADITSPLEFCVVRSIVEPEAIRLAVLNMTSRDIQRMSAIQARLDDIVSDGDAFSRADDELRLHLAEAARNPLLLEVFRLILKVGQEADWSTERRAALSPSRIGEWAARNRTLCAAIGRRDIEAAVEQTKLALAAFHQELIGSP